MATHRYPGVHVDAFPSASRPIILAATATAVFVGYTARGPLAEPRLLSSWSDYQEQFGGIRNAGDATQGDPMGFAVFSFFQNGGSSAYVVRAILEESAAEPSPDRLLPANSEQVALQNGANGGPADQACYNSIFSALEELPDVSILCLPGQTWSTPAEKAVIGAAVAHAEKMKNRMVIIDPPAGVELNGETAVTNLALMRSAYSAIYYPWIKVANPFYSAASSSSSPPTLLVAPSGFAAGIWARIDARRGVWKAAAGAETALLGVAAVQYPVEANERSVLNSFGINSLREMPGHGTVIWGARTLASTGNPEWRYLSVRRSAIMIEQSIRDGIRWAFFEPNDNKLWASLRAVIGSFMNNLFRAGAFQGTRPSDAYFVRCGLADTMNQEDIDRGRVIVSVGFAPLKPAEFVTVRIEQEVARQ